MGSLITRRVFNLLGALAATWLVEWTHGNPGGGGGGSGQNVIDDLSNLVVDDLSNQVVNS